MIRLILAIAVIALACWYLFTFKKQNREEQKKSLQRLALYGGCGLIVLLIATGRISAIYALLAGLIPWFERAAIFKRMYNSYKDKMNPQQSSSGSQSKRSKGRKNNGMDIAEAKEVLGINEDISEVTLEEINQAYKRLIQKNHPDSGGSEHLAQKIIEARKVLVDYLS